MAAVAPTTTTTTTTTGDIPKIFIVTRHRIYQQTSRCLRALYPDPPTTTTLPAVAVAAHPDAVSKAVSIAEIVKRRIAIQGDAWYQYSALTSELIEYTPAVKKKAAPSKNKQGKRQKTDQDSSVQQKGTSDGEVEEEEEEEEDPFEPLEEKPKPIKKKVPLLTIYISRSPLKELRMLYGEQSSEN